MRKSVPWLYVSSREDTDDDDDETNDDSYIIDKYSGADDIENRETRDATNDPRLAQAYITTRRRSKARCIDALLTGQASEIYIDVHAVLVHFRVPFQSDQYVPAAACASVAMRSAPADPHAAGANSPTHASPTAAVCSARSPTAVN